MISFSVRISRQSYLGFALGGAESGYQLDIAVVSANAFIKGFFFWAAKWL